MPRAVLLRCPICDAVRALEGKRAGRPRSDLYAAAGSHVREHVADETTVAIRKHHAVARSEELLVSATELDRLPTDRWRDREAATLPEDLFPDAASSTSTEPRPAETATPETHVD